MKEVFIGKVENGKVNFKYKNEVRFFLRELEGKEVIITIEKKTKRRTKRQNSALHLYFQLLADELNKAGLDMRKVLKPTVDIQWSKETVKDYLWRPIQKALLKKHSTTRLKTDEIDKVYEHLNRFLGEKFGIHVPFPSEEFIILNC